ncbi:MAG TPA: glucose-6-phosphate isomerase family protein [Candidatus Paceibacterota bacterium]
MIEPFAKRDHEKMREVLMSPDSPGPEIHYYMIRGGSDKRNITVWGPGTIGGEYIKAYGHYHVGDLEENYTILEGEGIIILQSPIVNGSVESFKAIKVKAGDKVHIPKNTGHLAINIGKTWLVTSDDSPVDFHEKDAVSRPGHADYEPFRKMQGAAYYIVEKYGKPTLVKNKNYKNVPEVEIGTL